MSARPTDFYAEQPELTGNTVTEISVPSGRLLASDDLREVDHFNIDPPMSVNSGFGLNAWAELLAEKANIAYAFVGNTCPTVIRTSDGALEVISPSLDEETDEPELNVGEIPVAEICTDLWGTMLTDYQNWLDHGGREIGDPSEEDATIFDVTPGKYRWTVYSHRLGFDTHGESDDRVTYARLELIEAH